MTRLYMTWLAMDQLCYDASSILSASSSPTGLITCDNETFICDRLIHVWQSFIRDMTCYDSIIVTKLNYSIISQWLIPTWHDSIWLNYNDSTISQPLNYTWHDSLWLNYNESTISQRLNYTWHDSLWLNYNESTTSQRLNYTWHDSLLANNVWYSACLLGLYHAFKSDNDSFIRDPFIRGNIGKGLKLEVET